MDETQRPRDGDETGGPPDGHGVRVRYWAAAKAAAGMSEETLAGRTVVEVLAAAADRHRDPRFARVLGVCSVLIDEQPVGTRDLSAVEVLPGQVIDLLPPFAGG